MNSDTHLSGDIGSIILKFQYRLTNDAKVSGDQERQGPTFIATETIYIVDGLKFRYLLYNNYNCHNIYRDPLI